MVPATMLTASAMVSEIKHEVVETIALAREPEGAKPWQRQHHVDRGPADPGRGLPLQINQFLVSVISGRELRASRALRDVRRYGPT